jgi:hypothetical protein
VDRALVLDQDPRSLRKSLNRDDGPVLPLGKKNPPNREDLKNLFRKGLETFTESPVLKEVEPIHSVSGVLLKFLFIMAVAPADLYDFGPIRTAGVTSVIEDREGVGLALGADVCRIDVGFS